MSSNLQQRRPATNTGPSSNTLAPNLGPSDTTPVVSASVIHTLLLFTAAMVIFPIGSYFLTVNTVFRGNATFAGGFAALMANVVLIGYIVVAWQEDDENKTAGAGTGVRGAVESVGEGKKEK